MPRSKLTLLREQKGLSQQKLASLIFAEQSTLSKYENNQLHMSDDTRQLLAQALGVAAEEITQGTVVNTHFENGSIAQGNGIGHIEHYYHVPKELLDSMVAQQNALTSILKTMAEKLG